MKLMTEIQLPKSKVELSLSDRIISLGSCFSDEIGSRLKAAGFDICINPFGTLYNPESIFQSIHRLDSAQAFTIEDCVEMGSGAGKFCSFSHHTSFARESKEEFLSNANQRLAQASQSWKDASKVLITLGTAMVWKHNGETVSNCLKRPSNEFTHSMLSLEQITDALESIVKEHSDKQFIFTVSPIRHLGDGARINTVSKSLLHLALYQICKSANCEYFPAYEIQTDQLRDYRFYAADLVHPRDIAVDFIWDKFLDFCLKASDLPRVEANLKDFRRQAHIQK